MAAADDAAGVTASIEVYSGRGIISWDMTPQERTELVSLIQKLPQVELKKIPSEGYVLIKTTAIHHFHTHRSMYSQTG